MMVERPAGVIGAEPAVAAAEAVPGGGLDAGDAQLVRLLAGRAQAGGMSLAGEGGLLAQLTKLVLEAGLESEFGTHMGYEPHERAGTANCRNGSRAKTVLTEVGPV